jgi:hypothetical protein
MIITILLLPLGHISFILHYENPALPRPFPGRSFHESLGRGEIPRSLARPKRRRWVRRPRLLPPATLHSPACPCAGSRPPPASPRFGGLPPPASPRFGGRPLPDPKIRSPRPPVPSGDEEGPTVKLVFPILRPESHLAAAAGSLHWRCLLP